ncbi:flagellar biosynthesis protein FlhB [Erwinia sp. HR93]|uniref:flagellar biosynthesis protein FlhB n=1 Tax=Erwinia sp. HR93 TaxID=3094840 RepID=UPI002ADECADD|nr:flagellar biosynthesis protein FlhB [Erwinia sp. HR93]MEA1062408.1 flagellar biosynthesis protein FlhB [Erwinia sp. HR93]
MSEESDQDKTEDPTPHRLAEARKKGDIPRSRELTSMLMLTCAWGLLWIGGGHIAGALSEVFHGGLLFDRGIVDDEKQQMMRIARLVMTCLGALLPIFGGLFVIAIISPAMIGGISLKQDTFKFDLKKMNPISGIKRLFSLKIVPEMLKSILKVVLVGVTVSLYLYSRWAEIVRLLYQHSFIAISEAMAIMAHCSLLVVLSLLPMVGFDVFYQLMSYRKKLRMTKQEIRDEYKQNEGDPHIKGRIRQQQREMASRRMMAAVPSADVVINNPTHYSVALQYKEGIMAAPTVVAKGAGEVALKIRELASEHRIPMLEAPPLARALYRHAELDQQIPATLYSAVAEVLAWVYGLRRWRKEGGVLPPRPRNIAVPASLDFGQESND